jgi:hypothetical protein
MATITNPRLPPAVAVGVMPAVPVTILVSKEMQCSEFFIANMSFAFTNGSNNNVIDAMF